MDASSLKHLGIRILVPSRGRSEVARTQRILPDWVEFVVPKSQESDYRKAIDNPLILIPDEINTLGTTRNYILDSIEEETIIMLDDDIFKMYCLTGENTKEVKDPEEVIQVLVNTAIMAKEAGARVFGFSQSDIRKYKGHSPFSMCTWLGTVIGVIGRKYRFLDGRNKVDVDYCLQNLLVERIVWCDCRYWFRNNKNAVKGGTSETKTQDSEKADYDFLEKRWGEYVKRAKNGKSNRKLRLNVERKQKLDYN